MEKRCKVLIKCWRKQAIQARLMFACISGVFCPTFLLSLTTGSQLLATFKALNVTCRCQLSHQEPYRPLFYDSDVIWTVWFIWESAYKTSQDVTLLDRLTRCAENGQGVLASAVTCQSQHLGHISLYASTEATGFFFVFFKNELIPFSMMHFVQSAFPSLQSYDYTVQGIWTL